jgi:hypothetical protein
MSPLPRSSPSLHHSSAMSPSTSSALPTSTSSSVRNPLHLKVNRLLSSHLEDSGTRAALDTLGELELQEGREAGSGVGAEKPIGEGLRRGGLRKEVDARMAKGSRDFLDAFGELKDVSQAVKWHGSARCGAFEPRGNRWRSGRRKAGPLR